MAAANSIAPVLTAPQIARFWSRVAIGEPDQCWPWTKRWSWTKHTSGKRCPYGTFWVTPRKGYGAHVIARFIATGEWPAGLSTLHTCDNPICCNPAHLFLGTILDNSLDMMAKRRNRAAVCPQTYDRHRGENHGRAKLTNSQVAEIRRLHAARLFTNAALGRKFGVSKIMIGLIVRRIRWSHLP